MKRKKVFLKYLTALLFFVAVCGLKSAVFAQSHFIPACIGDIVTLQTNLSPGNTYEWRFGSLSNAPISGAVSDEFTIPNATSSDSGTYYVVIDAGTSSEDIDSFHLSIYSVPQFIGNLTVCEGVKVRYEVDAYPPGMSNYVWVVSSVGTRATIAAGGGSSDDFVEVIWDEDAQESVGVTYEDPNGCIGSYLWVIQVNPAPTPSLTGVAVACYKSSAVTLTYRTEPGMSNYTWTITGDSTGTVLGGGTNTTNDYATVTWKMVNGGSGTVSVNYENSYVCRAVADKVIDIDIYPVPAKPVIDKSALYPLTSAYCPITPFPLSVTNSSSNNTYTWSGVGLNSTPFGPATGQGTPNPTFELHSQTNGFTAIFPIYVVVDSMGCTNSDTGAVRLYSEIDIKHMSTSSACPEVPLTLSATFVGGNQPYGYVWSIEIHNIINGIRTIDTILPAVNLTIPSGAKCGDIIKAIHYMVDSNTLCQSDTMSLTFLIEDPIKPKFLIFPPNTTVYADASCNYDASQSITGTPIVDLAEGCPTRKLEYWDTAIVTGSCSGERIIHRVWFITNDCEDTTWQEQLITVADTIAPNITRGFAFDMPIFVDNNCEYLHLLPVPTNPLNMPFATDNCVQSSEIVISVAEDVVVQGGCARDSIVIRRWVAEDPCGNVSLPFEQIFTLRDVRPPTFAEFPENTTIYSDETCGYDADPEITGMPVPTDNCTDMTVATYLGLVNGINALTPNSYGYSDNYYNVVSPIGYICPIRGIARTWMLKDDCGNVNFRIQIITIADTTRPIITITDPLLETIYLDEFCLYTYPARSLVTVSDNCTPANRIRLRMSDNVVKGDGNTNCGWTITRTWTARDLCDNVSTLVQTYVVLDTIKPEFVEFPEDIIVYKFDTDEDKCVYDTTPANTGIPTYTDNCTDVQDIKLTYRDSPALIIPLCSNMTFLRTWRIEDECGNVTTRRQQITVRDSTPPVITTAEGSMDSTIYRDNNCRYRLPNPLLRANQPDATDNCTPVNRIVFIPSLETIQGDCPSNLTIIRTWIAYDNCGNASLPFTQTFTILDTTPPVFEPRDQNYPLFVVVNTNGGEGCEYDVDLEATGQPTATDNCTDDIDIVIELYQDTELGEVTGSFREAMRVLGQNGIHGAIAREIATEIVDSIKCKGKLYRRDFIAKDLCGNADTTNAAQAQYFVVKDTTAPHFTPPPATGVCKDTNYPIYYVNPTSILPENTGFPTNFGDNCSAMDNMTFRRPTFKSNSTDPLAIYEGANANSYQLTYGEYSYVDNWDNVIPMWPVPGYITRTWYTVDECGNFALDTQRIEIVNQPTVLFLGNTTVCEDAEIRLVAVVFPPSSNYTYIWREDNGLPMGINSDTLILSRPMRNYPYTFDFMAYNVSAGCAAQGQVQVSVENSRTMRIYTDAPFDKGQHIICYGTGVTLTAEAEYVEIYNKVNMKMQWFKDGIAMPGEIYPVLVDTIFEQHTYQLIMYQYDSTYCDVFSNFITVAVFPQPDAFITQDYSTICEGGEAILTAHLSNNTLTGMLYQWYFNDLSGAPSVAIPNATNPTYAATEMGIYWFTAVQLTTGCTAVMGPNDTAFLIVEPKPEINVAVTNDRPSYCLGSQVYFAVNIDPTSVPGFANTTYTWYKNGVEIPNLYLDFFTDLLNTPGKYDYDVKAKTDVPGCETDLWPVGLLEVLEDPLVSIYGHSVICGLDSAEVDLVVNVLPAPINNTSYSYQWMLNHVALAHDTLPNYKKFYLSDPTPYNFSVQVTDNLSGCVALSDEFAVYINNNPTVTIAASAKTICEGETVTLTANVGKDPNLTYQWFVNGNPAIGMGATTPVYTTVLTKTDTFTFQARQIGGTGCGVNSDTVIINVTPKPAAPTISGVDTICEGQEVHLVGNITGNLDTVYTWYKNGIVVQGANLSQFYDYPTTVVQHITTYRYNAVVTVNGCSSDTASALKTVVVYPNPSVVISGDAVVCDGSAVMLTANVNDTAVVNNTMFTYQWRVFNANIAGATTDTLMRVQNSSTNPYIYTVAITNEIGCQVISAPFNVYVNAKPTVFITSTEDTICKGGQVTLTANLGDYNAPNLTYKWVKATPNPNGIDVDIVTLPSTTATITVNPTAEDTFKVIITQTTSGCVATGEKWIEVKAAPTVTIANIGAAVICEGGEIKMAATVTGGVPGGEIYTWYRNNILIKDVIGDTLIDHPTPIGGNNTTYNYMVMVTQAAANCSAMSAKDTIVVKPAPIVTVVAKGNTTICDGDPLTLKANVTPPAAAGETTTYQWYRDGIAMNGKTDDSLVVTEPARGTAYNYYVEVRRLPGCAPVSNTVAVTVVPKPVATITSNRDVICAGGDITFTANVTPVGVYNYVWTVNGTPDPINSATFTKTFTTAGTQTIGLTVTPNFLTGMCSSVPVTKVVTVNAIPQITGITTTPNPARVCSGGEVKLKATMSGGVAGGEVYTWYINNAVVPFEVLDSLTDHPFVIGAADSTVYTYKATVKQTASGCTSTVSGTATAIAYKAPTVVVVAQNSGSTTICASTNLVLQANVVTASTMPASPAITYQWYENNVAVGTNSATYTVNKTAAGTYTYHVVITKLPGCSPASAPVTVTVVPAVTGSVTANLDSICQGGTVTLTANLSNLNPTGTYQYKWQISPNGTSYTDIPGSNMLSITQSNLAAGTHYFRIVATPTNYGNGLCDFTSAAKTIVVRANPSISALTVNPLGGRVCSGGEVKITATTTGGLGGVPYTYTWYINAQAQAATTNNVLTDYPTVKSGFDSTIYTYTVMATQGIAGCTSAISTISATVTAIVQPELVIIPDDSLLMDLCKGGKVGLTGSIINSNSVYGTQTYSWYANNLKDPTQTTNKYSTQLNQIGSFQFYAVAKSSGAGCKDATSNIVIYNVVPQPTWADVSVTPKEICEGEQVELNAKVQGGVQDAYGNTNGVIQWQKGTPPVNMGFVGGHGFDTPDKDVCYTATYLNPIGNGCKLADATPVCVKVKERPNIVSMELLDANGNKIDTLCGNDINSVVNLKIVFKGIAPYTFILSESKQSGVTTQTLTSATNTFTLQIRPDETARYSVTMLNDQTGCPALTNTLTATVTLYVTHIENLTTATTCGEIVAGVNPTARVFFDIVSLPTTGTAPVVDIVFVNPMYAAYNTTGAAINVSGSLNYVEFETPTDPGDYEMLLIINGCEYPFTLKVLASNNTSNPLVVQRWDDVVVVNNNPDNNGGYTFTSYQWYKNGELIPGATGQYYQEVGGISGFYSVMLYGTDKNGKPVQFMTCDIYFAAKGMMSVYPVPAQTFQSITIKTVFTAEELDGAVLDVYTILGQHLKRIPITSNTTVVDGFAAPGSYVGKITTGTKEVKAVKMVVIQ